MINLLIIFTDIFTQNGTFVIIYSLKRKISKLIISDINHQTNEGGGVSET